jgi:hypothetical protein
VGTVTELKLVEVGEGFRFEAEKILDGAKGNVFERMAVVGRLESGELYVAGTANAGEMLVLLEQARHFIVFGKEG